MTNKELEKAHQDLRNRKREALKGGGVIPDELAKEFDREEDVLSCIEMIHSILIYGGPSDYEIDNLMNNKYLRRYIEYFGKDKVRELAKSEIEEFKTATIEYDVYTDSEGVTYNSVHFKDESIGRDDNNMRKLQEEYVGEQAGLEAYNRLDSENKAYVDKVIENFDAKAIKYNIDDGDSYVSVLVKDENSKFQAWIDISVYEDDINDDWNKYIFHLDSVEDNIQSALQGNDKIWDYASSCALDYVMNLGIIIDTDDYYEWVGKPNKNESKKLKENKNMKKLQEDSEENNEKLKAADEEVQKLLDEVSSVDKLHEWIIQDVLEEADMNVMNDEEKEDGVPTEYIKQFLDDLYTGGCQSGIVNSLIYTADCVKVFIDFEDELYDYIDNLEASYGTAEEVIAIFTKNMTAADLLMGSDTLRTYIVWCAYEDIAGQLYDEIYSM